MSLHGTQRALEAAGLSPDFGYDRGNDDNYRWEREPALYSQPFSRSGSPSRVGAELDRERRREAQIVQEQQQTSSLLESILNMIGGQGDAFKNFSLSSQDMGMIPSLLGPPGFGAAAMGLKNFVKFAGDVTAPEIPMGATMAERRAIINQVRDSTTVGNTVRGRGYNAEGRLSLEDTFGYLDRPNEDKQGNFLNTVREFVNNPTFAGSQGIDQGNLDANLLQGFRAQGRDAIRGEFPGNAFQLDSDIIASIVGERQTGASGQVANFAARGNIGPQGSLAANQDLTRQAEGATTRLGEIGAGVLGGFQQNINDIRDRATLANQGFQLGDDLFDVTPFADERSQLITDRTPTIRSGILAALGGEPLFDIPSTLGLAGRAQGNVSGVRNNNAFLDQIANRQTSTAQSSRGLGTRGSGAF